MLREEDGSWVLNASLIYENALYLIRMILSEERSAVFSINDENKY